MLTLKFSFSSRKKQKKGIITAKSVDQMIHLKKFYCAQLDRLDSQLQHENIDQKERTRLRAILEKKYVKHQQEDWIQFQKLIE